MAEVSIMVSLAFKQACVNLIPEFQSITRHRVCPTWISGAEIVRRIEGGEPADLVIMSSGLVEGLIKSSKLLKETRVDLAKCGVGAVIRAGSPVPDISSVDALKRTLLSTSSIAVSSGPSGYHLAALFMHLGIAEEMHFKTKIVPDGATGAVIGDFIARGEAELGFQQVSELLPITGIQFIGTLPEAIQRFTVFSAAVSMRSEQVAAAKMLISFLNSSEAGIVIKKCGMVTV